jgi:NADH-quinone oxidoreductase subunit K
VTHLVIPTVAAALIFSIGVYGLVRRRNAILVLMAAELMLNAVNLHLVTMDLWWRTTLHSGQALAVFVITVAAAEVGVGVAIVLLGFRTRRTVDVDAVDDLAEAPEAATALAAEELTDGSVDGWAGTDEDADADQHSHSDSAERVG